MSCIGNGGQKLEVTDGGIKTEAPRKRKDAAFLRP
jgi:hypothetical protein